MNSLNTQTRGQEKTYFARGNFKKIMFWGKEIWAFNFSFPIWQNHVQSLKHLYITYLQWPCLYLHSYNADSFTLSLIGTDNIFSNFTKYYAKRLFFPD